MVLKVSAMIEFVVRFDTVALTLVRLPLLVMPPVATSTDSEVTLEAFALKSTRLSVMIAFWVSK